MNQSYKIAVNQLLGQPNLQKIKINFNEKVKAAKEDIVKLERLKIK